MQTSEIITAIKIKGSFPTSDDLFSNDDFLVILNHQMKTEIIPIMMLLSEEFFVLQKDYTITQGASYRIPKRSIGSKLRDVQIIDGSGNVTHPYRLDEVDRDTNPSGYYVVKNSIELSSDYTTNTLRLKYFARPNTLVLPTSAGQITSIDTVNKQVVVSSLPSAIATSSSIDFVQSNNPYDLLQYDEVVANVSGTTVTMTNSLPDGLEVGDWLCVAGQSPVPMIPEEMHPVLVQSALVACLASKKDSYFEKEAMILERVKQDAIRMLDPRIENDSIKFRSGRLLGYFSNRWY